MYDALSRRALLIGLLLAACSDTNSASTGATGGDLGGGSGVSTGSGAAGGGPASSNGGSTGFEECAGEQVGGQVGVRAGNIVWVIDTSGSMDEEAAIVQQNLNQFASSLATAGLSDYRVVVVSEPDFVTVPNPLGSDAKHFRYVDEAVDSEEPLTDLLARFADYSDFLLKDVLTHFVVVTDDESSISASEFISEMARVLGGDFRVHAIASPPGAMQPPPDDDDDDDDDEGCTGVHGDASAPGVQHYSAAEMTGGLTFSICTDDWSPLFAELVDEVVSGAPVPCDLAIPQPKTGVLDPNLVNVLFTPPGATQGVPIPRTSGAANCGSSGWHYDNPAQPSRIVLCPNSCADVTKAGGTLDIAFGCQTVLE
jgi:hypothetical protein